MVRLKRFAIRYYSFLTFGAALLFIASWLTTSLLQQKLDSLDKDLLSVALEYRISAYMQRVEFRQVRTENSINSLLNRDFKSDSSTMLELYDDPLKNKRFRDVSTWLYRVDDLVKATEDIQRIRLSLDFFLDTISLIDYQKDVETLIIKAEADASRLEKKRLDMMGHLTDVYPDNVQYVSSKTTFDLTLNKLKSTFDEWDKLATEMVDLNNILVVQSKKFYDDLREIRQRLNNQLTKVKTTSWVIYAIATLMAFLAKIGEHYRDIELKCDKGQLK